jgi:hypothetical protein
MIDDANQLAATQERIAYFQRRQAQLQMTTRRGEISAVTNGYHTEIDKMQAEVREYLNRAAGA